MSSHKILLHKIPTKRESRYINKLINTPAARIRISVGQRVCASCRLAPPIKKLFAMCIALLDFFLAVARRTAKENRLTSRLYNTLGYSVSVQL